MYTGTALRFECTKEQFVQAMAKSLGLYSVLVASNDDVSKIIESWLRKNGVGSNPKFIEASGCEV